MGTVHKMFELNPNRLTDEILCNLHNSTLKVLTKLPMTGARLVH